MRRYHWFIFGLLLLSTELVAKIQVVTTTPDLAYLVKRIGAEKVEVDSLLTGSEDPHYIDVTPIFIRKVMAADVVCFVGLDLEIGWLPKVLNRAGKKNLLPGGSGHCDASAYVDVLDVLDGPQDRSLGDVHAKGNSHYTLAPQTYLQAAKGIKEVLKAVRPSEKESFEKNYQILLAEIQLLQHEIEAKLSAVREKVVVIDYHSHFRYYIEEFKLNSLGAIEEVPGVSPSAGRLAQTATISTQKGLNLILAAHTAPIRVLRRFSQMTKAPILQVPLIMNAEGKFSDYFVLQRWFVDEIVKHAK